MVYTPLATGATAAALLVGAYLYFEIGAFASPQVPRTLFNEKKLGWGLIAGLAVGSPLSVVLIVLFSSFEGGYLVSVLLEIVLLVGLTELAQWLLLRSVYFGTDRSGPFYALALRSGIAAILILAAVTRYFGGPSVDVLGAGLVVSQAIAILSVEVAGGLLSIPAPPNSRRVGGGPLSGGLIGGVGFFLLGLGLFLGSEFGIAAAALAALGGLFVYQRLRRPTLSRIKPPEPPEESKEDPTPESGSGFGRTDR
ncbi:MAG: hypothetical protein L3K19_00400 [Thermoplasmata archaeon]|nr:hypothetical protein [Thermoplasmata archaeon]